MAPGRMKWRTCLCQVGLSRPSRPAKNTNLPQQPMRQKDMEVALDETMVAQAWAWAADSVSQKSPYEVTAHSFNSRTTR